jgi:uncharacterized membrane protein SirB2
MSTNDLGSGAGAFRFNSKPVNMTLLVFAGLTWMFSCAASSFAWEFEKPNVVLLYYFVALLTSAQGWQLMTFHLMQ